MRRALVIAALVLLALAAPAAAKTFDNPKGSLTVPSTRPSRSRST